jgi:hypothetical protein
MRWAAVAGAMGDKDHCIYLVSERNRGQQFASFRKPMYRPQFYCYLGAARGRNALTNLHGGNRSDVVARPGARTAESLGVGR